METTKESVPTNVRNDLAEIEIFMPITRHYRIEPVIKMLRELNTAGTRCTALFCIDTTDITVAQVEDRIQYFEMPFQTRVIHTNKPPVGEIRMSARRDRIRDMLNFAKKQIRKDADMVFMVEDDSQIDPNALQSLLQNFAHFETAGIKVGLISGLQVGRHGYRMLGAWRANDLHDPTVMETIPFTRKYLLEKVDAAGLFCFITPAHLFTAHEFYWHDECFAPDVTYGLELRKQGYENFVDWSVTAGHVQRDHSMLVPNDDCVVVRYEKQPEGHWLLVNHKKGGIS